MLPPRWVFMLEDMLQAAHVASVKKQRPSEHDGIEVGHDRCVG